MSYGKMNGAELSGPNCINASAATRANSTLSCTVQASTKESIPSSLIWLHWHVLYHIEGLEKLPMPAHYVHMGCKAFDRWSYTIFRNHRQKMPPGFFD
ncbi:Acetate--CoA ligase [Psidium guajava]|nr:Acetate--CoA ligase [Psidium guajava]